MCRRLLRAGILLVLPLCLLAGKAHALPDLRPEIYNVQEFLQNVPQSEVDEGCAGGTTDRRLIRFALLTHNDGPDDWNLGDPACPDCQDEANWGASCTNPLFYCGLGHERRLVASFARPELLDQDDNVVAQGYKPGFCLVDSNCDAGGQPQFTNCNPMGITAGCADRYDQNFACMYVDFTDEGLPAGDYTLRLTSDPENRVAESDETNNVVELPVTIGPPPNPCGNSGLDAGETCDDGGTVDGDGCDATCQVEACYTCSGEPSTCVYDGTCGRCRRTLGREAIKLAQARNKILAQCELARIKGRHDDPCPDPGGSGDGRRAADKIAKAVSKFEAKIARTCGGDDRACGGDLTDEVPPWLMQFPAACPGMRGGSDPECTATVDDCGELAACVDCLQRTAIERGRALIFDDLTPTDPRLHRARNRCQRSFGAETYKLLAKELGERGKCWAARRKGTHADVCPDLAASTASAAFKAARKIATAEARHDQKVCKACGGSDKTCGGASADLDPQVDIGAPASCYDVTIPGGPSCSATLTTTQDLVECAACVSEYHAACINAALVAEFLPYPPECVPAP